VQLIETHKALSSTIPRSNARMDRTAYRTAFISGPCGDDPDSGASLAEVPSFGAVSFGGDWAVIVTPDVFCCHLYCLCCQVGEECSDEQHGSERDKGLDYLVFS